MASRKEPGLISLNASRRNRHRQMVTGKAAIGGMPPRLFGIGMLVLVVGGFIYYRMSAAKLDEQRRALLAQQRAVETSLGGKLRGLRDQVESQAKALGARDSKPFAKPGVDFEALLRSPGVYLRLRHQDLEPVTTLRTAALGSLRDGFSACLAADPKAAPPGVGVECKESLECQAGELCTEFHVCQRPSSPFNMRLVYRALSVLEPAWVEQVNAAGSDLAILAQSRMLDSITRVDVPLAIEVYQRARYALLVLDETPQEPLTEKPDPGETPAELLARVPHAARIGLWSLPDGEWLAYKRSEATGELRDVGPDRAIGGIESVHARTRQANSCALALDFKAELMPAAPEPAPTPAP